MCLPFKYTQKTWVEDEAKDYDDHHLKDVICVVMMVVERPKGEDGGFNKM